MVELSFLVEGMAIPTDVVEEMMFEAISCPVMRVDAVPLVRWGEQLLVSVRSGRREQPPTFELFATDRYSGIVAIVESASQRGKVVQFLTIDPSKFVNLVKQTEGRWIRARNRKGPP